MKKDELQTILKTLQEIGKETEQLEAREKEKYQVGLLLKECTNSLRNCISSLAALESSGVKVNSARHNNLKNLRITLINILDLCVILLPGSHTGVQALKTQLVDKINPKKKVQKKGS